MNVRRRGSSDGSGDPEAALGSGADQVASPEGWFWCLKHRQVEGARGCPNWERLGPYASREEAAGAPERTRRRSREWAAEEERER